MCNNKSLFQIVDLEDQKICKNECCLIVCLCAIIVKTPLKYMQCQIYFDYLSICQFSLNFFWSGKAKPKPEKKAWTTLTKLNLRTDHEPQLFLLICQNIFSMKDEPIDK